MAKYLAAGYGRSADLLRNPKLSPLKRVFALYDDRIRFEKTRLKNTPGCLITGLAHEMSGTSEKIRMAAAGAMRQLMQLVADCIREGITRNEINPPMDALKLAEYLEASWRGALSSSRGQYRASLRSKIFIQCYWLSWEVNNGRNC